MLLVRDHPSVRERVSERPRVANAAARIGLAGQRKGSGPGPADLSREQMHSVEEAVRCAALCLLVNAHSPQGQGRLGGGKVVRGIADL